MTRHLFTSFAVICFCPLGRPAQAAFIPGHVYVSLPRIEPCGFPSSADRIYDIDPVTGQFSTFLVLPPQFCGGLTGMTFTPDGSKLRVLSFYNSSVLEIDGQANVSVALGYNDGVYAPAGNNGIAYSQAGDLFILNSGDIEKFPGGNAPGQVFFAPFQDVGDLDFAPNGDLYASGYSNGSGGIFRFGPDGVGTLVFGPPFESIAMAVNSAGDIYVVLGDPVTFNDMVVRYTDGDPNSPQVIATGYMGNGAGSIALSADEQTLYVAAISTLWSVDLNGGTIDLVSQFSISSFGGAGIAVYVPEPSSLPLLILGALALSRRHRSCGVARR